MPSKGSVTSCPVLRFFFIFVQQDLEGHFQNEPEWKRYQRYTICILLPMKRLYCDTLHLILGVLLDITGVLVESTTGGSKAIPGSIEAVKRLSTAGIPVRFVTNETQRTRASLVGMLHENGYSMPETDIFPPALAMAAIIKEKSLKPFTLVHPNLSTDLSVPAAQYVATEAEYNCVVIGDAVEEFSYKNLNAAFQIIADTGCPLYSLGKGKFYREDGKLMLDVGPFAALLEFATEKPAVIVGKPSQDFFLTALKDMNVEANSAVMIGDDIVSDCGGAQSSGIQGVLVRTGKFRQTDENHPKVTPDAIVDNLAMAVDMILNQI